MGRAWTDGPRELIQHAVDHLQGDSDFDRRIAMISIDGAVELMVKVYLGLPKRARGSGGPSRKDLEAALESFPELLALLEKHGADRLRSTSLDDIEWFHRLRNELYHSGNGLQVERAKVETYLSLARSLFENLFDEDTAKAIGEVAYQTGVGRFMEAWIQLEREQRAIERDPDFPRRRGASEFARVAPELATSYERTRRFRNELVHGLSTPDPDDVERQTAKVAELIAELKKVFATREERRKRRRN